MPAILTKKEEQDWLNNKETNVFNLIKLLHPFKNELDCYPISLEVNNPSNNNPALIKPI